jgi:hypothetical protein
MRWALGKHYYRLRTATPLPNPEEIENGKLFRKALGIVLEHPTMEWKRTIDDRRLYTRRVVSEFLEPATLDEVLAVATQQTGVALRVDPAEGAKRECGWVRTDRSLAEFMQFFVVGGWFKWVREGEGYRLVRMMEPDSQNE